AEIPLPGIGARNHHSPKAQIHRPAAGMFRPERRTVEAPPDCVPQDRPATQTHHSTANRKPVQCLWFPLSEGCSRYQVIPAPVRLVETWSGKRSLQITRIGIEQFLQQWKS